MNINFAGHYQFIAKGRGGKLGGPPPPLDKHQVGLFLNTFLNFEATLPPDERGVLVLRTAPPAESGPFVLKNVDNNEDCGHLSQKVTTVSTLEPRKKGLHPEKMIVLTGRDNAAFRQSLDLMGKAGLYSNFVEGFFYREHPNADIIEL